jgi:hypothetical protein
MRCDDVRRYLSAYVDGELSDLLQEAVENHVKSCDACAKELERLVRVVEQTQDAVTELPAPETFTASVMERVRAASRTQWARAWWSALWLRRRLVTLSAVGVLLICAVTYHVRMTHPEWSVSPLTTTLLAPKSFAWNSAGAARVITRYYPANEPMPGVRVYLAALQSDGKEFPLWRGRTDGRGMAEAKFTLPPSLEGAAQLVAYAEDDRVARDITVERQAKILLTTDKPLYQPRQTVHIRTLSLLRPSLKPAEGATMTIEIEDAKQNKVFKQETRVSEWGIAAADFQLADEVNLGTYKVKASLVWESGSLGVWEKKTPTPPNSQTPTQVVTAERTFSVQRYVLPKFKVEAKLDRAWYQPKQTVKGTVNARYFFGKPVSGGQVTVKLSAFDYAFHQFAVVKGKTNAEGLYEFEAQLPDYFVGQPLEQGNALVRCEVSVRDTANHEETTNVTAPVASQPIRVALAPEGGRLKPKMENIVYVVTSYPDGSPAPTRFMVGGAANAGGTTDALGVGEFRVTPTGAAQFAVDVRDAKGNAANVVLNLPADAPTTDAILLRADKAIYKVGDTARLTVLSSQQTGAVFVDAVREGQTLATTTVELQNGKGQTAFDLSADFAGAVTFHAYVTQSIRLRDADTQTDSLRHDTMSRATRTIIVQPVGDLQVKVSPDKKTFRPGDEAKIEFAVSNDGRPTAAAIGLDIVDESVFALQERHAGLEKVYFAIEEDILKPRATTYTLPAALTLPTLLNPSRDREGADTQQAARVLLCSAPAGEGMKASVGSDYEMRLAQAEHRREVYERRLTELTPRLIPFFLIVGIGCIVGRRNPKRGVLLVGVLFVLWVIASPVFQQAREKARMAYSSPPSVMLSREGVKQGLPEMAASAPAPTEPEKDVGTMGAAPPATFIFMDGHAKWIEDFATYDHDVDDEAKAAEPPTRIRQFFPETLLSEPALITDERGRATLSVMMADSITTWRLTGLASSRLGQLGSVGGALRVFQDFFVDIDFPVALTQGDEVAVPIVVYNYLPAKQTVRLTVEKADWFEPVTSDQLSVTSERVLTLNLNEVRAVHFPLRATRIGRHNLTVRAKGDKLSDAIRREVEVFPNGREVAVSVSGRLDGTVTRTVTIPADAIPDASKLLVKIYPGVFSQTVEGLESMLSVPYG